MSFPGFQPPAGTPLTFLEAFSAVLDQYRRVAGSLLPALILCTAPVTLLSHFMSSGMPTPVDGVPDGAGLASMGGRLLMLMLLGFFTTALMGSLSLATLGGGSPRPTPGSVIHDGFAGLGRSLWLVLGCQLVTMVVVGVYTMVVFLASLFSVVAGLILGLVLGAFLALFMVQLALVPAVGLFWRQGFTASVSRAIQLVKGSSGQTLGVIGVFFLMTIILLMTLQWPLTLSYMKQIFANIASGNSAMPVFTPVGWQKGWMLAVGLLSPAITALAWLASGVQVINLKAREDLRLGVGPDGFGD
jgi:hypothetical protein